METKPTLNKVVDLINKHGVTAYEIEKNTSLSAVGVQKIIDGKTKRPQQSTIDSIYTYIINEYEPMMVSEPITSYITNEEKSSSSIFNKLIDSKDQIIKVQKDLILRLEKSESQHSDMEKLKNEIKELKDYIKDLKK